MALHLRHPGLLWAGVPISGLSREVRDVGDVYFRVGWEDREECDRKAICVFGIYNIFQAGGFLSKVMREAK